MYELPLFPLHAVLFPGRSIHLHIFEERYQQMINRCLEQRRSFGVVLIRQGREALGPLADPYEIGCRAEIVAVERLSEGRMNITAAGRDRFRTLALDHNRSPYWVAQVEDFPVLVDDPAALHKDGEKLRRQVEQYLQTLAASGFDLSELEPLPGDPVLLAYAGIELARLPARQQLELFSAELGADLIRQVSAIYRRELSLLKKLLAVRLAEIDVFSLN